MFMGSLVFNQDIGNWNVSSGKNWTIGQRNYNAFDAMFNGAKQFNQDLSNWCTPLLTTAPFDFSTEILENKFIPIWEKTCD